MLGGHRATPPEHRGWRRAKVKRMVEHGIMLASAFPRLDPELQGPADAGRWVQPAPQEEESGHR